MATLDAKGQRAVRIVILLGHLVAAVALTLLTQVGGAVWLVALLLTHLLGWRRRAALPVAFAGLYAATTLVLHVASPLTGRVALACVVSDAPVTTPLLYCVLNRNYVTPKLKRVAEAYADHMATRFPGTRTLALDGNFPLFAGFPLLPHLSHDDGRKLDLAYYYRDTDGTFRNGALRSPLGYFAFEQPQADSAQPCADRKHWLSLRWDLAWLQPLFPDWQPEPGRMREALRWLSSEGRSLGIEKIFIEPHLAARFGAAGGVVRFQGCRAARHDDHIHIQVE